MTSEGIVATVLSIIGFVFFGTILLSLIFRPKSAERFLKIGKVPWSYWGEDSSASGLLLLLVPILFLFFACSLCFIVFGFFQSMQR